MNLTREMLGGTSVKEKDIKQGKVFSYEDKLRTSYNWDTGVAMGKFLAGLKDGKILV